MATKEEEKKGEGERPSDLEILEQINTIQDESKHALCVGNLVDINLLKIEYKDATSTMKSKIEDLSTKYQKIRKVRGDGNCFLRAYTYGLFEYLIKQTKAGNNSEFNSISTLVSNSKDILISEGFSDLIEDFWEVFNEQLIEIPSLNSEKLQFIFNDENNSNYLICYLRFIISGYLRRNAPIYEFFLDDGKSIDEFCKTEVEPMNIECDQLQVIALSSFFADVIRLGVQIEYLDNSDSPSINHHNFPEDNPPVVFLLYRPGHYDILYH